MIGCAAATAGCGYTLGYVTPPGTRTVAVPIFHNSTFGLRREIEFELTSLVRQELQQRTDLRLVDSGDADLILRGNIVDFREDLVVQGNRNSKVESSISARVDVLVEDHVNGTSYSQAVVGREPFSPALGEEFDSARGRALENLAERIVAAVEYWDYYPATDAAGESAGPDGEPRQ